MAGAAQPARAQDGTAGGNGGPGWITSRDDRWRERFQGLLLGSSPDVTAGWQLARDVGRPAVPLLWSMVDDERSDVDRRLVVLAAAMLAGGSHEDERLFAWLDQQKPMLEERTLVAMTLALGPRRTRSVPDFWSRAFGPTKTPELLLAIAVRLAAARIPGADDGAPVMTGDDPGLAAATAYAGLPVPPLVANRWWNLKAQERHADLFWRGSLLGAARRGVPEAPQTDVMRERARGVMELDGEALVLARAAAVAYRTRVHDLRPDGARLDPRLLLVATSDLTTAAALQPWLQPTGLPRDDEPHRLAVAYALSRPIATVVAERDTWGTDARFAGHIATALAWRLLGAPSAPIEVTVRDVPEWNFVQWASGVRIDRTATCKDPQLQTALDLIAAGRMPRPALRQVLEEALWRWGSHPGLAPWQHERLLVRDLLLSGSKPGGGKYQAHVQPDRRYYPTGLDRNDGFFVVAVALYEFLMRPRAPLPPEHRLPQ